MQSLLLSKAKYIRTANVNGIRKMMRNILALQQNIKTIALENHHVDFERVKRYYALFTLSPPVNTFQYILNASNMPFVGPPGRHS